jgi:hypothetical protein
VKLRAAVALVAWSTAVMAAGPAVIPLHQPCVVAITVAIVGTLIVRGARIGGNPVHVDMAASVTRNPSSVHAADYQDMIAGLSYGALLIVSGFMWLVVVIVFHKLMA